MKVIICGAGQVDDVTVVDNNPDLVRRATDTLDVQGIAGHASYPDILDRAGARDADMIVAATHSDEVNMVTCQVAHSVFSVPRKIARLRAQSYLTAIYSDLYRRDHMPIDVVISPEREVAEAALRRLRAPEAFDIEEFIDGGAQFIGLHLDPDCPVLDPPRRRGRRAPRRWPAAFRARCGRSAQIGRPGLRPVPRRRPDPHAGDL